MKTPTYTKGVSVVEVMIGLFIFSLILIFIFHTFSLFFAAQRKALETTQALYLAEEGTELLKYIRDASWTQITNVTPGTTRYLAVATGTIAISATPEVINSQFTRSFILRRAYRNSSNDLVPSTTSGATIDSGSFVVESRVTWGANKSVELHTLLTNIHDI